MSDIKIILIHGNGSSTPNDIWWPYVKLELEKLGFKVIAKQFPDMPLAREKFWIPFLKHELKADANTIIIGHSSGAIAAMRFTEKNKIFGSVLVGAYYTDLDIENEKLSGYFDSDWDWQAIKNNQNWIVQFASTDDPWIPIEEPRFVHSKLSTEYYESTDKGHFTCDDSQNFPELVHAIKQKLKF